MLFLKIARNWVSIFLAYLLFTITGININSRSKLISTLEKVYRDDQKFRVFEEGITINERELGHLDYINLIKVRAILDKYGWPSNLYIHDKVHIALFLVIQHADVSVQKRYYPILKRASESGRIKPSRIAMLEDRIAISENKRQTFGTQIGRNLETGEYFVKPMVEPSLVDYRRSLVGLEPLKDYASKWKIKIE